MRFVFTGIIVASVLVTGLAWADPTTSAEEVRRTELYREGVMLGDRGDWSAAAARFREVVEIRSAPKALVALAVAEDKLGHLVEAKRLLMLASNGTDDKAPTTQEVSRTASDLLARLTPRIPTIALKGTMPPGTLSIDGNVVNHREPVEVDPGEHALVFESTDGGRVTTTVTVAEGARSKVSFPMPASAERSTKSDAVEQDSSRSIAVPIGPVLVAGAGVAIVGLGSLAWALGKGDESDAKSACGGGTTNCPRSVESTANAAETKIVAGNILVAVGAGAVVGGVLWWLLTPRAPKAVARLGGGPLPAGGYLSYGTAF